MCNSIFFFLFGYTTWLVGSWFPNQGSQTPGVPALGHGGRSLLPEFPGPVGRADSNCLSSLKWPAAAQMLRDSTFCRMLSDCGLAEL